MKQIIFASVSILILSSCSIQKQASNLNGRSDEVYFTPNDTRKKSDDLAVSNKQNVNQTQNNKQISNAGNYTSSYSNRFRNFGSSHRFNYNNYQASIVPSLSYNNYTGNSMGLGYVDTRFGYASGFNSPFSMYYGYNMPYYNPFFSYGWGNSWMNGYYPYYTFNPYFYNPCSYYYGFGYGYYNPYYRNYY